MHEDSKTHWKPGRWHLYCLDFVQILERRFRNWVQYHTLCLDNVYFILRKHIYYKTRIPDTFNWGHFKNSSNQLITNRALNYKWALHMPTLHHFFYQLNHFNCYDPVLSLWYNVQLLKCSGKVFSRPVWLVFNEYHIQCIYHFLPSNKFYLPICFSQKAAHC